MKKDVAESLMHDVVRQLSELRREKGWSYQFLASRAGVTHAAISHLEHGRRKPSLMLALRLSKALDAELSDLLKESELIIYKILIYMTFILLTAIKALCTGQVYT